MTAEKRKRAIEYIQDGSERQEKFQKRLEGIMKKAHELAVLTGAKSSCRKPSIFINGFGIWECS
jgi:hypothetical protein